MARKEDWDYMGSAHYFKQKKKNAFMDAVFTIIGGIFFFIFFMMIIGAIVH